MYCIYMCMCMCVYVYVYVYITITMQVLVSTPPQKHIIVAGCKMHLFEAMQLQQQDKIPVRYSIWCR